MKILAMWFAVVGIPLFLQSIEGCLQNCADLNANCHMMKSWCHRSMTTSLCPLTCGICKPCFSSRPALSNCEVGTCRDLYSPLMCYYLKLKKSYGCLIFRNYCRATCGFCQGCYLPPSEIPCTHDCSDKHQSCKYWKKTGYCSASKGFPHVISVCPLSCKRCVPCPTKKPNTALPPTKEEAEARSTNSTVFTSG